MRWRKEGRREEEEDHHVTTFDLASFMKLLEFTIWGQSSQGKFISCRSYRLVVSVIGL
jgi:hypothetical protein